MEEEGETRQSMICFVFLLYRQKVWRHFIKVEWEIKTVI